MIDWESLSSRGTISHEFQLFNANVGLPILGPIVNLVNFELSTQAYQVGGKVSHVHKEANLGNPENHVYNFRLLVESIIEEICKDPQFDSDVGPTPMYRLMRTLTQWTRVVEEQTIQQKQNQDQNHKQQRLFNDAVAFLCLFLFGDQIDGCLDFSRYLWLENYLTKYKFSEALYIAEDFANACHNLMFKNDPTMDEYRLLWPTDRIKLFASVKDDIHTEIMHGTFMAKKRLFFHTTECSYFGRGPPLMKTVNVIFVVPSSQQPLVFRMVGNHYIYVGVCFIYDLMNGETAEMVNKGQVTPIQITIH